MYAAQPNHTDKEIKYFASFIDDCSRMSFIYLMQNKSQLLNFLKEFIAEVVNSIASRNLLLKCDFVLCLMFDIFVVKKYRIRTTIENVLSVKI